MRRDLDKAFREKHKPISLNPLSFKRGYSQGDRRFLSLSLTLFRLKCLSSERRRPSSFMSLLNIFFRSRWKSVSILNFILSNDVQGCKIKLAFVSYRQPYTPRLLTKKLSMTGARNLLSPRLIKAAVVFSFIAPMRNYNYPSRLLRKWSARHFAA